MAEQKERSEWIRADIILVTLLGYQWIALRRLHNAFSSQDITVTDIERSSMLVKTF